MTNLSRQMVVKEGFLITQTRLISTLKNLSFKKLKMQEQNNVDQVGFEDFLW